MLEFIGNIIVSVIYILFLIAAFFIGWAFIIWVGFSPTMQIRPDASSVEHFAYVSLWTYTVLMLAYVVLGFFVKSRNDLPPSFQFLALFLKFNDVEKTKAAASGEPVDVAGMAEHSINRRKHDHREPNWVKKARTKQYKKAAKDMEIEREAMEAEAAMHKATREYNQAKAKAEAYKKSGK